MPDRRSPGVRSRRARLIRGIAPLGALAIAGALAASIACYRPRERPDTPVVTIYLDDTTVTAGGFISGRAIATDRSGVTYLSVSDSAGDSLFRQKVDYLHADSVELDFLLHVTSNAALNSPVLVRATAIDDQLFTVTVDTTAWVRSVP